MAEMMFSTLSKYASCTCYITSVFVNKYFEYPPLTQIPKASFFRSMAGGVPSGATEGSSMGRGTGPANFIISGSFFGTPFAPKNLFFCNEKLTF